MQKYSIQIAGMSFHIVSDATPEDIATVTDLINQKVDEITAKSPKCSTAEAAVLCALSYCSEKVAMQSTFQTLEELCKLRAEEIERLRKVVDVLQQENERLHKEKNEQKAIPVSAPLTKTPEPQAPISDPAIEQLSAFETPVEEPAPENEPCEEKTAEEEKPAEAKKPQKGGVGQMFEYLTFREEL